MTFFLSMILLIKFILVLLIETVGFIRKLNSPVFPVGIIIIIIIQTGKTGVLSPCTVYLNDQDTKSIVVTLTTNLISHLEMFIKQIESIV